MIVICSDEFRWSDEGTMVNTEILTSSNLYLQIGLIFVKMFIWVKSHVGEHATQTYLLLCRDFWYPFS